MELRLAPRGTQADSHREMITANPHGSVRAEPSLGASDVKWHQLIPHSHMMVL